MDIRRYRPLRSRLPRQLSRGSTSCQPFGGRKPSARILGEKVIDHAVEQGGELARFLPDQRASAACIPFLPGSRSRPRREHDYAAACLWTAGFTLRLRRFACAYFAARGERWVTVRLMTR